MTKEYKKRAVDLDAVKAGGAAGLSLNEIGRLQAFSISTFDRRRSENEEIDAIYWAARTSMLKLVADKLVENALDGDVMAARFILERRGGWIKTTNSNLEVSGKGPSLNIILSPTENLETPKAEAKSRTITI